MATKKYSVLAVLDVLKLYSDEEHCLHITDIKKHIKEGCPLARLLTSHL